MIAGDGEQAQGHCGAGGPPCGDGHSSGKEGFIPWRRHQLLLFLLIGWARCGARSCVSALLALLRLLDPQTSD